MLFKGSVHASVRLATRSVGKQAFPRVGCWFRWQPSRNKPFWTKILSFWYFADSKCESPCLENWINFEIWETKFLIRACASTQIAHGRQWTAQGLPPGVSQTSCLSTTETVIFWDDVWCRSLNNCLVSCSQAKSTKIEPNCHMNKLLFDCKSTKAAQKHFTGPPRRRRIQQVDKPRIFPQKSILIFWNWSKIQRRPSTSQLR